MDKVMWAGRFAKELNDDVNDFNSSIKIDGRMYRFDTIGSVAHAEMLAKQGIISPSEAEKICAELKNIADDIESGKLAIDPNAEDIHMFVEAELTKRLGDIGKKLHTARSRNDQVAVDVRLYLREEGNVVIKKIKALAEVVLKKAEENKDTIMPGYTHLQRAQPITFAHHILAYAEMFLRDIGRFKDALKRMNVCPLGSCALAGTTHPIDRNYTAERLGFDSPCMNSVDGVSDRDFVIELAAACSLCMTHLSRFSEEIILWCSWEYGYVELDDSYSTGSSVMPQKKNPDIAELIRGKTGRTNGNLVALLTVMKGLPLAYNKDMQEDKEAIFDSLDTLKQCLDIFAPMLETAVVKKEKMLKACYEGFINATDCADYLVKKGVPFRTAYKISGSIVRFCIENGFTLESLPMEKYKEFSSDFESDIYSAVDMANCVKKRVSIGAPSPERTEEEIEYIRKTLNDN